MCESINQKKVKEKQPDNIFQIIEDKTGKKSNDLTSDDISEILKAVCNCPIGILP